MSWAECACENTILTLMHTATSPQVRRQCVRCGRAVGNAIKHSDVPGGVDSLPRFDFGLRDRWDAMRQESMRAQRSEVIEQRQEQAAVRREWYAQYLQSEQWREKREAVLNRARHTCEGCGAAKATEVHHLTYDNVGDELLWQLVAVCRACHEKAHHHADTE